MKVHVRTSNLTSLSSTIRFFVRNSTETVGWYMPVNFCPTYRSISPVLPTLVFNETREVLDIIHNHSSKTAQPQTRRTQAAFD
eukprot:COSAG02_NODE_9_length_59728_cov_36.104714_33_plen_83_part_00